MSATSRRATIIKRISLPLMMSLAFGCSQGPSSTQLGPGGFRLIDLGRTEAGASHYVGTTEGAAPICRFEIVIEEGRRATDPRFSFAAAALVRQPGSDCTTFLRALAKQLGFNGELPSPAPVDRL